MKNFEDEEESGNRSVMGIFINDRRSAGAQLA